MRDFYRLGTLMHYLADAFTYPHTDAFCGDLQAHRAYERELHETFSSYLRQNRAVADETPLKRSLTAQLLNRRNAYENNEVSCEGDCKQILHNCTEVFFALCGEWE